MADQDLTFAGLGFDLGTAQEINRDTSFTIERAYNTVPVNALGSMTPITPLAAEPDSNEWGGFFRDLTKAVVGYGLVKDAQRSGVQAPANTPAAGLTQPSRTTPAGMNLMPLLLVGAAIFAAVKLAK